MVGRPRGCGIGPAAVTLTVWSMNKTFHFASSVLSLSDVSGVTWERPTSGGGSVSVTLRGGKVLVERFDKAADALRCHERIVDLLAATA